MIKIVFIRDSGISDPAGIDHSFAVSGMVADKVGCVPAHQPWVINGIAWCVV